MNGVQRLRRELILSLFTIAVRRLSRRRALTRCGLAMLAFAGANLAGFKKVADAMMAQGIV